MKTQSVAVDMLISDPANARKHSKRNIEAIKASLARFGQQKPIVVDDQYVVRAGNGTLEAAKALGWTELEAVMSNLQGTEMAAFAIADNRTSELAEWDYEVLGTVLSALQEEEPERGQELGWAQHELVNILAADWTPPEPVGDLSEFATTDEGEDANGQQAAAQADLAVAFAPEDVAKLDELALRLSPDEPMSRRDAVMAVVVRALADA